MHIIIIISGKGESEIDHYSRKNPNWTADRSNGDIACDSYHQYKLDNQLVKFSISWPRILPTGDPTNVNQRGIDHYNHLIDDLLVNGLIPVVTIYHWDMPQKLMELGGWTNKIIADYYEAFARLLFSVYGNRVRWWVTLNEPQLVSVFGYGQGLSIRPVHPPGYNHTGVGDYLAIHNFLLSHARVYHMYHKDFKHQKAYLSRVYILKAGSILHPILSPNGDYPPVMRERVDKNSKKEGRIKSRLPHFSQDEIEFLKGTLLPHSN
ncbi:hypothetical protein AAG570_008549 [Ranatra chinensis]|uniref:Uncharacterized protein n=1 Tax=Ranatra chinensis TaxID=642074 RepID=A0ABD0YRU8_9HEMI